MAYARILDSREGMNVFFYYETFCHYNKQHLIRILNCDWIGVDQMDFIGAIFLFNALNHIY